MAVIGRFGSDLSITRKTDGNFGNVSSAGCFQSRVSKKTVVEEATRRLAHLEKLGVIFSAPLFVIPSYLLHP